MCSARCPRHGKTATGMRQTAPAPRNGKTATGSIKTQTPSHQPSCAHAGKAIVIRKVVLENAIRHRTKQMPPIANSQLGGCNSQPNMKRARAAHAIRLGKTLAGDKCLGGGLLGGRGSTNAMRWGFAREACACIGNQLVGLFVASFACLVQLSRAFLRSCNIMHERTAGARKLFRDGRLAYRRVDLRE